MRLIFAGTPDFAARHLQSLLDSEHQLVAVYTQPDRRAGRGKKLQPSPVKQLALEHNLPVYQPASLKSAEAQAELAALAADVMVVVAYGLLLPQAVLDIPRHGCINVHASLLPRWRGAAPIQRAIAAGDSVTGVTIMQMEAGLDTGPMLVTRECTIEPTDTAASLQARVQQLGAPALLEALQQVADGSLQPCPQDDEHACYAHKLSKEEARIDWSLTATENSNRIRAFNPFPVAFFQLGDERVRVWQAEVLAGNGSDAAAGQILGASADGIDVACGDGVLRLLQLQLPGKKAQPAAAIVNGYGARFQPGTQL